jgi:hypothetical protein
VVVGLTDHMRINGDVRDNDGNSSRGAGVETGKEVAIGWWEKAKSAGYRWC